MRIERQSYPVNILVSIIPKGRLVCEDKCACLLNIPLITLFKDALFKLFQYKRFLFFGLHFPILSSFIIYLALDCLLSIHQEGLRDGNFDFLSRGEVKARKKWVRLYCRNIIGRTNRTAA